MYKYIIFIIILCLSSCKENQKQSKAKMENIEVKSMLQGFWLDENTESPMLQFKGDSIHYMNTQTTPAVFKVIGDTLFTYGTQVTSYHIEKYSPYILWLQSELGEVIQLVKSDNTTDSTAFIQPQDPSSHTRKEVIQKDRVVFYKNVRYRGYVYINPSQMKITRPEYSEEGFKVDKIYYDNIIHICVYEGKNKLFGKDISKKEFIGIVPEDFHQWAVLDDMEFIGVDETGYKYQAKIAIPDESSCYLVNLSISTDGNISYSLEE